MDWIPRIAGMHGGSRSREDRNAARADEQADHDQDDPPQDLTPDQGDDARDDKDDGDDPEDELHGWVPPFPPRAGGRRVCTRSSKTDTRRGPVRRCTWSSRVGATPEGLG